MDRHTQQLLRRHMHQPAQVAADAIAQKLKVTSGALLSAVDPDGAAAAAGLLATRRGLGGVAAGDVIVGLNGRQVLNGGDLFNALEQCAIGEKVKLTVLRSADQVRCCCVPALIEASNSCDGSPACTVQCCRSLWCIVLYRVIRGRIVIGVASASPMALLCERL
eukprot:GHRQ01028791.1.p1 GENE.GHRQ01028791.1~~GHRQ01028791.1.p1  ORF type:complete len:164 (-),score=22.16 GHRQ01028791.1:189-680(-)